MDTNNAYNIMQSKHSQLCIGIDFDIPISDRLSKAMELIDQTAEFAAAYKPNRQYWLGNSVDEMIELNKRIHQKNCFSIIDHKLSDIGSTNISAIKTVKEEGFDLITVSPFPGNLEETCKNAKQFDIGVIALVLMSNPQAKWMLSYYQTWAQQTADFADGAVLGTTNHVTNDVLFKIQKTLAEKLILAPGLGNQGGRITDIIDLFGPFALFNVSRGINQAPNYYEAAQQYHKEIINLSSAI